MAEINRSRRLPTILSFRSGWGKKHLCFFQSAATGNRTPNSGVKGSRANHRPNNGWNRARILVQVSIYRGLLIGRDGKTCVRIRPQNLKLKVSAGDWAQWKIVGLFSVRRYLTLGLDYSIGWLESVTFQLHDRILSSSVATSFCQILQWFEIRYRHVEKHEYFFRVKWPQQSTAHAFGV